MHVERSKCNKCGFINYNWNPLPHCEHYLKGDYKRIQMRSIQIPKGTAYYLALDYKHRQEMSGIVSYVIDPDIWYNFYKNGKT